MHLQVISHNSDFLYALLSNSCFIFICHKHEGGIYIFCSVVYVCIDNT